MVKLQNYIDGKMTAAREGKTLDVVDPAVGAVYASVPASTSNDIDAAVQAAQTAFPAWAALSAEERGRYLRRIADLIDKKLPEFAAAESKDTGKPVKLARSVDIPRSALNFRFFADAATQFSSECHANEKSLNYTLRKPIGVVACISPWNLPLYLLSWKIAPALAAGNTVVAKPSEITPVTAHLLAEVCSEAGLPAGVLNIVHGQGAQAGLPLVRHPGVKAVSFTGSTKTGGDIAAVTAPLFKKLSLEMGGKNPTVVFADCDFDKTVDLCVRAAFTNQGQICLCGSRILVERPLYEKFKQAFLSRVQALKTGDPTDESTDQGSVVSQLHFDKVIACIRTAKDEGGKFLCGGNAVKLSGRCAGGFFIEPTVIEGLSPECRTNQEEIFGPVATLAPFDSEAQALAMANGTAYGLAASVFTNDLTRAHRFSRSLESGLVWVNTWMNRDLRTPFGGVKSSGVGREGGLDAMRFFTEPQNICVQL